MINLKRIAFVLGATLLFSMPACSSQIKDELPAPETEEVVQEEPKVWVGKGFTEAESTVLSYLQERGITDRAALATLLGNIKQESRFETRICEGGSRTGYQHCYAGGFGLLQWTTAGRYRGLGTFARQNGMDPNTLKTQLMYMFTEVEWRNVESSFKTPGNTIPGYMNAAKRWLGWGVLGKRTSFAYNYYDALIRG